MRRTRGIIAGVLGSACLLLAACGGGGGGAGDAPEAEGWRDEVQPGALEAGVLPAEGTPGLTYLQELATQLEKDYPGSEVKLTFANTEARPALEQRWRSGDGPDVDYGMFDGTNPAQLVWAQDDALVDLRPYLEQKDPKTGKSWLDAFTPAAIDFMTDPEDKGIYAVPTELSTQVLFYNAGMFKEKGIEPPKTWDDLIAAAGQLKEGGVDPIAITGLFPPYMGMWTDNLWLRTVGWEKANQVLVKGEGHITDDPGFLDGLKKAQELRDKEFLIKGFEGTDFTPAQALFFQEKAGMILMGNWLVSEMKDVIPEGFEIGVLPFPTVEGGAGDQKALMAAAQLISINADSENIPLALEWASRFTSKETQTERAKNLGDLSAVKDVPSPTGVTGIDKVVSGADQLVPREFAMSGTDSFDAVYAEVTRLMFGKQDADETLTRLDEQLRKIHGN